MGQRSSWRCLARWATGLLTVTQDGACHGRLDNVNVTLDKGEDSDEELDDIAESGVEETTPSVAQSSGEFLRAAVSLTSSKTWEQNKLTQS